MSAQIELIDSNDSQDNFELIELEDLLHLDIELLQHIGLMMENVEFIEFLTPENSNMTERSSCASSITTLSGDVNPQHRNYEEVSQRYVYRALY
jgi:hypothetical protein